MRRAQGFTLIELVVVMLIISGGLLGITSLFSNSVKSLSTNEDLQFAAQAAQQCAERVLALRRNTSQFTVSSISSTLCNAPADAFTRTLAVAPLTAASAPEPCLTGSTCSMVTVTVNKTATPALYSLVELMLVY